MTVDALLRRAGFVPLWLASLACAFVAGGTGGRPVWRAFLTPAPSLLFLLALRGSALRGDAERGGQPPPPLAARVRRITTRVRAVLALALGSLAWWSTDRGYGRWWLSALLSLLVAAVVVYAMGPLPPPADPDGVPDGGAAGGPAAP